MGLKITLIGSGNVAWNLAHALDVNGHTIIQVISRTEEHAKMLAKKYGAYFGTEMSGLYNDADLIILTVNDSAYQDVIKGLKVNAGTVVCHTSGPIAMEVLSGVSDHYGVFYPLQSFNKDKITDFLTVPLLIEAVDGPTERMLLELAETLSNSVHLVDSADRKKYHLAAVFANNFTNMMYVFAERYLEHESLNFDLLKPIIYKTALRLADDRPSEVQTGPAIRHDQNVINEHLEMIKDPELKKVYAEISALIMSMS